MTFWLRRTRIFEPTLLARTSAVLFIGSTKVEAAIGDLKSNTTGKQIIASPKAVPERRTNGSKPVVPNRRRRWRLPSRFLAAEYESCQQPEAASSLLRAQGPQLERRPQDGSTESTQLQPWSAHARRGGCARHLPGAAAAALGAGMPALGEPVLRGRSPDRGAHPGTRAQGCGREGGCARPRGAREDEVAPCPASAGARDGASRHAPPAGGRDASTRHPACRRTRRVRGHLLERWPRPSLGAG